MGPCATGVGTEVAHVVEPVDGGFGFGEDLARIGRHVFGAEGEFEEEDCKCAFEMVEQHPPHCALADNGGIGFVEYEVDSGAGGLDTFICRVDAFPFGGT